MELSERTSNLLMSVSNNQAVMRSLRTWKIIAILACVIAICMTAVSVVIWRIRDHGTCKEQRRIPRAVTNPHAQSCPRLPPMLPLPKPLPSEIKAIFEKIEDKVKSLVDNEHSLPAVSMNVFYQDDTLWSGHFGSKQYEQPTDKPDDNTVYRIGSITKIFPVLLIFKLYEEGKISSIDDTLSSYAPDFDIKNPFTRENITLREIVSQMSGLPREAPCMFTCNTTSAEQLALLRNRTLVLPPWKVPSYSNLGYALLGRLLTENLLNMTFESWTTHTMLKPLGMLDSGFSITEDVLQNMAFPYGKDGKRMPFMDVGWLAPAGQMHSTLNDLTKLGMMFTQPNKQSIFRPTTLRQMMSPVEIAPDGHTVWGSPWEMKSIKIKGGLSVLVRGKLGLIDSYLAYFSVIPELQLGINLLISATPFLESGGLLDLPISISETAYQLLIPELNATLTDLQTKKNLPIDPTPYTGSFLLNATNPFSGETKISLVKITTDGNLLRLRSLNLSIPLDIEIKYIDQRLVFQASQNFSGMTSCLYDRMGTLADFYYDPPSEDGLAHGFRVPGWGIVAIRMNGEGKTRETL